MGYRLIALDIDGTLRDADAPVSERTRDAVDRVRCAGAAVTLATGRIYEDALPSAAELRIDSPIISSQGAHAADPGTGDLLWHRPLESEMAASALEALLSWDLDIMAFHLGTIYAAKPFERLDYFVENSRVEVRLVDALEQVVSGESTRLVATGEEAKVDRLEGYLKARFDSELYVTRSVPSYCEVLHPSVGKEKALATLCSRLGIRREDTVAFGNGYNDVEMIRWAGLGVAVEGSVPQVLEVADAVAGPVGEDGVARVLEDMLCKGMIG